MWCLTRLNLYLSCLNSKLRDLKMSLIGWSFKLKVKYTKYFIVGLVYSAFQTIVITLLLA